MRLHMTAQANMRPVEQAMRHLNAQVNRTTSGVGAAAVRVASPMVAMNKEMAAGDVTLGKLFRNLRNTNSILQEHNALTRATGVVYKDAAGNSRVMLEANRGLAENTASLAQRVAYATAQFNAFGRNLIKTGKNVQWAGRQVMVGLTIPMVMLGAAAVRSAEQYDRGMTRIVKVTNFSAEQGTRAHEMQMESVRRQTDALIDLGAQMGFTAEQTTDTIGQFAQMGYEGAALDQLTEASTRLARVSGADLKTSIELTRIAAQAYNTDLGDLNETFARMNIVENNTAISVAESALGLPVVAAIANQVGMTLHETNGLLAMMKESGISAKEGATALRTGLLQLVQQATPQTIEAFDRIGLSFDDMRDKMNEGYGDAAPGSPLGFFDQLAEHFDKIRGNQVAMNDLAAAMSKMFGVRQAGRMITFLDGFNKRMDESTVQGRAWLGVMAETEEVMRIYQFEEDMIAQSAAGIADVLRAELNVEMARFGQIVLEVMNVGRRMAVTLMRWFNNLDDSTKRIVFTIAGLLAALGPVTMVSGIMLNATGQIIAAVTAAGKAFRVTTAAIEAKRIAYMDSTRAIAAETAALNANSAAAGRNTVAARSSIVSRSGQASALAGVGAAGAASRGTGASAAGQAVGRSLGMVTRGAATAAGFAGGIASSVAALVSLPIIANPGEFFRNFGEKSSGGVGLLTNSMKELGDTIRDASSAWNQMGADAESGIGRISGMIGSLTGKIADMFATIASFIANQLGAVASAVEPLTHFIDGVGHLITGNFEKTAEAANKMMGSALNTLEEFAQAPMEALSGIQRFFGFDDLADVMDEQLERMEGQFGDFIERITGWRASDGSPTRDSVISMLEGQVKSLNEELEEGIAFRDELIERGFIDQNYDIGDIISSESLLTDEMKTQLLAIERRADLLRRVQTIMRDINAEGRDLTPEQRAVRINRAFRQAGINAKDIENVMRDVGDELLFATHEAMNFDDELGDLNVEHLNASLEQAKEKLAEAKAEAQAWNSALKSGVNEVMGDVVRSVNETLSAQKQAVDDEFAARREAMQQGFSAQRDAMQKSFQERQEAEQEATEREREAMRKTWDLRDRNHKKFWDAEQEAFSKTWDARREAERAEYDKRVERIDDAAKRELERLDEIERREEESERERRRWLEQYHARVDYLEGRRSGNITMREQLARGDLSGAAITQVGLQAEAERYLIDSYRRQEEEYTYRKQAERQAQRDAIEEQKELERQALEEWKSQQDERYEYERANAEKIFAARKEAADDALAAEREAADKAQRAREKARSKQLELDRAAAEQRAQASEQAAERSLQAEINAANEAHAARQRGIENYLRTWQRITPATAKEFESHVGELTRTMERFGISGREIGETYSDYFGTAVIEGFRVASDNAALAVAEDKKWDDAVESIVEKFQKAVDDIERELELGGFDAGETFSKALSDGMEAGVDEFEGLQIVRDMPGGFFKNLGKRMHTGGPVRGGWSPGLKPDETPRVLQHGEWVINKESARAIGDDTLDFLNNIKMHTGGKVGYVDFSGSNMTDAPLPMAGKLAGDILGLMATKMQYDYIESAGLSPKKVGNMQQGGTAEDMGSLMGAVIGAVTANSNAMSSLGQFAAEGQGTGADWRRDSGAGWPPPSWGRITANVAAAQNFIRSRWNVPHGVGAGTDRGVRSSDHCLTYDTKMITKSGLVEIGDVAGTVQTILTRDPNSQSERGVWVEAPITEYGTEDVYRIVLKRRGERHVIRASGMHKHFISKKTSRYDRETGRSNYHVKTGVKRTFELAPGDRLSSVTPEALEVEPSNAGIVAGFVYGDGTVYSDNYSRSTMWGHDIEMLKYHPADAPYRTGLKTDNGVEGVVVKRLPRHYKHESPLDYNDSPEFLAGWLAGYLAADGHVTKKGDEVTIASADLWRLEAARDVAAIVGISTNSISMQESTNAFTGNPHIMYSLGFDTNTVPDWMMLRSDQKKAWSSRKGRKQRRSRAWVVESVEFDGYETVYCANVDGTHAFALEKGILTGNSWGKALDIMVSRLGTMPDANQRALGNQVANWHLQNPGTFGTKYIIWDGKINSGDSRGWRPYTRYGANPGPTLGHYDHVHVSYMHDGGKVNIPGLRSGGKIKYDNTLANLHRGETVLKAPVTKAFEDRVVSGGGGNTYNLELTINAGSANADELSDMAVRKIEQGIKRIERSRGRNKVVSG